ncbi:MAG: hypothetical protein AAF988_08790, partial [Pseudomonadota bacterium]
MSRQPHIKNPLTIVGIFAGITEISGTAVLPFLEVHNQDIYIWFLMFFPTILVLLFFLILYLKPECLYAPSDYKTDEAFFKSLKKANKQELDKVEKSKIYYKLENFELSQEAIETKALEIMSTFYPGE